ncbi:hypothetical protein [Sphaerisporangium perillae]|uniref:hypothetical protein n=1 Tax=Sphaerisporangium perillae TaxID=2935860 RepID=UPI00200E4643|nr:hypothetical protein [Sphaerisporangium perillae]
MRRSATVDEVFDLADRVGRRPVGNLRKLNAGFYRLRFQRNSEMRTHPETFATRNAAEGTLWTMGVEGRADCVHDRRFRALVLLATFASLRWGEVSALRRTDVDLDAGTVRVRAAFIERSTGGLVLGPPKSKAGRRFVGIPKVIVPALREHLNTYVKDEPDALGRETIKARVGNHPLTWAFVCGAGDGNRTRAVSLGIG